MEDISEFSTSELDKSAYVRPFRLHYKQDGRNKAWDCVLTHHAVFVIVYNTSREKLVLVRQFRPSVYFNAVRLERGLTAGDIGKELDTSSVPASKGICIELCAGIIGKVNCSYFYRVTIQGRDSQEEKLIEKVIEKLLEMEF